MSTISRQRLYSEMSRQKMNSTHNQSVDDRTAAILTNMEFVL